MAHIVLDLGHGQDNRTLGVFDPGAAGNGTRESSEVRLLGPLVASHLRAAGHKVSIIESGLYTKRAARADAMGANLLVSLHLNSFSAADANGTETFVHPQASAKSRQVAAAIQPKLVAALGTRNRGVKEYGFAVLAGKSPAALVEFCFISNASDMTKLRARRGDAAKAVADGILVGFPAVTAPAPPPAPVTPPPVPSELDRVKAELAAATTELIKVKAELAALTAKLADIKRIVVG